MTRALSRRGRSLVLLSLALPGFLGCLLGAACDRFGSILAGESQSGPEPDRARAPTRPPSPSASAPPPGPGVPGAHETPAPVRLDPATRRKMKIPPRRMAAPSLAFGKGRLGLLTDDALVVRDVRRLGDVFSLPLEHPRALTALADGSLLAASASHTLRLMPQDRKARTLPRIVLLPESSLFGDRRNPDRFWVLPGLGKTLFGYDAAPNAVALAPAEWIDLEGFDLRALGSVRDGSFLYTDLHGLVQFYGAGKKQPVSSDLGDLFRLLPGSRPDTVWALAGRSARLFRILAGKLYLLRAVELETTPYEAAAAGELLAILELSQPDDAAWSFVLEIFDVGGKRRLHAELPADESLEPGWEARLVQDRALALGEDPPLCAVGGKTHLDVYDPRAGSRVFSAP